MAGRTSGSRFGRSSSGALQGSRESAGPVTQAPEDEQARADHDQAGEVADQTTLDSHQSADAGTVGDVDLTARDRDLADGGDPEGHVLELTRSLRDRSAQQQEYTSQRRFDAAAARDVAAHARDMAASARDQAAARQDREWAAWDLPSRAQGRAAFLLRAAENLRGVAADRAVAAELGSRAAADREQAARDREQAARDRDQAARDRLQAQADREALLYQLAIAETDALTGARTRAAGLADLDNEIDRARRTTGVLAVAYVDVVGLKAVNDAHGHAAGDALLQRAVGAIRADVRSYDSIIRLGGDEFLCVISGATIEEARRRFAAVQAALAADPDPCSIRVGFAALTPEDDAASLIERADAKRPSARRR